MLLSNAIQEIVQRVRSVIPTQQPWGPPGHDTLTPGPCRGARLRAEQPLWLSCVHLTALLIERLIIAENPVLSKAGTSESFSERQWLLNENCALSFFYFSS